MSLGFRLAGPFGSLLRDADIFASVGNYGGRPPQGWFGKMGTFALASLVIAFLGTLGAIHLLRMKPEPGEEAGAGTGGSGVVGRSAGGLGMLMGIAIASFYMEPWPHSSQGLVYASVFFVVSGLWLERKGSLDHRPLLMIGCGLAGTLVSSWFELDYLDWSQVIWSVGFVLLLASALLAPFAVAMLSQGSHATPALPSLLALVEIVFLLLFGAFSAVDNDRRALFLEFAVVAMPAVGALAACLIYVGRMPWRAKPAVLVGMGGQMAVGLLVAWGALRLGARSAGGAGATTALLWLVAVPNFELARGMLAWMGRKLIRDPLPARPSAWSALVRRFAVDGGYSTVSAAAIACAMGMAGLVLWHLDVSGYWVTVALLPAFALYVLGSTLNPFVVGWLPMTSAGRPHAGETE